MEAVEGKILAAMAVLYTIGVRNPPRIEVAFLSGYSHGRSTYFAEAITNLVSKGCIERPVNKVLRLTSQGWAMAPSMPDPPRTNADVHLRMMKVLNDKRAEMVDVLSDGAARSLYDLCHALGYTHSRVSVIFKRQSAIQSFHRLTPRLLFPEQWLRRSFVKHEKAWSDKLHEGPEGREKASARGRGISLRPSVLSRNQKTRNTTTQCSSEFKCCLARSTDPAATHRFISRI